MTLTANPRARCSRHLQTRAGRASCFGLAICLLRAGPTLGAAVSHEVTNHVAALDLASCCLWQLVCYENALWNLVYTDINLRMEASLGYSGSLQDVELQYAKASLHDAAMLDTTKRRYG